MINKKTIFAMMLASSVVWAAGKAYTVTQSGKAFSEKSITLKLGDTLRLVNEDTVTHSIFVREGGYDVNEAQKPGETTSFVADKKGEITVRCAIHPKMSLKVKIQ